VIWHIGGWRSWPSSVAAIAMLVFGWSDDRERELSTAEIAQLERPS